MRNQFQEYCIGKTYEKIYGKEKSNEIKEKISLKHTKIPSSSYKKISKEFCYTLGTILTDGSINKKLTYVTLDVTDKDFAIEFKNNIEKWTGFKTTYFTYKENSYKKVHRITLNSIIISKYLKGYDYTQIKNFSHIYKRVFLRAIFDAEGSVECYKLKKPLSPICNIDISSINYEFILFVKDLLSSLGITTRKICIWSKKGTVTGFGISKNNLYALIIGRRKDIEIFNKLVGFTIKRKQNKLNKLLKSYKGVTKGGVKLSWNTGLTIQTNKKLKEVGRKISRSLLKNV